MKQFTVRLDDDLHAEVTAKAQRELRSLNAVIARLLERWVADKASLAPVSEEDGKGGKD